MTRAALPFPDFLDPVAIAIGPVTIKWYALAYIAGFLLGVWWAQRLARRDSGRPTARDIEDFLVWAVLGVILGGRLGYVLFYRPELLAEPLRAIAIWEGGMAFHGGMLGVALAVILYARANGFAALRLGDRIACAVPIGLFFGRLANFVNNELWGRPTDLPWGVVFPIRDDLEAVYPEVPRHPSQLYEAFLEGVVLFVLLAWLASRSGIRNRPGLLSGVFIAGYGAARFAVEFVRQPDLRDPVYLGFMTQGQMLSVPMVLAGAGLIGFALRRPRAGAAAE